MSKLGMAVAVALAALSLSTAARADVIFTFDADDGGWTAQNLSGSQLWSWDNATGSWKVGTSSSISQTRLLSPLVVATGTSAGISIEHAFNFEPSGSANCFDGGNVKFSINGSALALIDFSDYVGPVSGSFSNPLAGQEAWCGDSGGFLTSTASGPTSAGDVFQFVFDAGWDSSVSRTAPNWEITSVALRGFELANGVPEPGTFALLGLGLAGLAATRRRRQ